MVINEKKVEKFSHSPKTNLHIKTKINLTQIWCGNKQKKSSDKNKTNQGKTSEKVNTNLNNILHCMGVY